ncbi:MAG: S26 family signal peptidase [Erythrobacter sp.]|uniref:S26 family signal peptidase n=1 Tax=Erythrobacter sp. TaxID=1042 RepID=UPI001B023E41|nr:S26 family signal peptidase [Erythrobacter sp.]MBO6767321.1 S26 family signal peptidase [Erythrobacter sp.]
MKRRTLMFAGSVVAATLLSAALPLSRILIWNVTASVPTGLYHIRGKASLHVGERVAIDPPPQLRAILAERGYLPRSVPLLKEVAALTGDTVCRSGLTITINGERAGEARTLDSLSRPLPTWQGCQTIAADEIFVMNRSAPGSFDGRYFGPIARAAVIGRASPVWTDEAGNGAHAWFARPHMNSPSQ